jgi:hypothetical protein
MRVSLRAGRQRAAGWCLSVNVKPTLKSARMCLVLPPTNESIPTSENVFSREHSINQTYRYKLDAVKKAEADDDWSLYVFLHERPYRLGALLSATKKGLSKNPSQFWSLVGNVWQDSENIHQNLSKWKRVWGMPVEGRRACMSDKDIHVFDSLPNQVDVWRGTSHKRYIDGLSWTLDQDTAVYFARRFCSKSRVPLVAQGITFV